MQPRTNFDLLNASAGAARILAELRPAVEASSSEHVRSLVKDLPVGGGVGGEPAVSVSLVGQYDAGKSSIIRALTRRSDIIIDADVSTSETAVYDWHGIRLVDTPGIRAGYASHDAVSEKQVVHSDLVLFVITDELFSPSIGEYFRELAFEKRRSGEMMLLVNKMDQSPGGPEVKRGDIERVTAPLKCEDFRTVFMSTRLYEEALTEHDAADCERLLTKSGMQAFTTGLNDFVAALGLGSRLTTPLYQMHAVAMSASALTSATDESERAAVTLLSRRLRLVDQSRSRMRNSVKSLLEKCFDGIALLGESLASAIDPDAGNPDLEARAQEYQDKAKEIVLRLQVDVAQAISTELETLKTELEELGRSGLAANFRSDLDKQEAQFGVDLEAPSSKAKTPGGDGSDLARKLKLLRSISQNMSEFLIPFTQGTKVASKYGPLMASGSQAHKAVLKAGDLFGKSFKPWEAAGMAAKLGKFARILGPVAAILQVVGQIMEDRASVQQQLELRNARNDTRALYVDSAQAVRQQFLAAYEKFEKQQYDPIRINTEAQLDALRSAAVKRGNEAQAFGRLADEAMALIDTIHSATT